MLVKIDRLGYYQESEKEFGDGIHVHVQRYVFHDEFEIAGYKDVSNFGFREDYGVADTVEQIIAHHSDFVTDETRLFYLKVNAIWAEDEPEQGGWRWHKWGNYIGIYPESERWEYIYDDLHRGKLAEYLPQKYVLIYEFVELEKVTGE